MFVRGLKLIGLGTALAFFALVTIVDGGVEPESCTVTVQPGQSIQQEIDRAAEGAIICLGEFGKGGVPPRAPQHWRENLVIVKSITLRGLHHRLTRIEGEQEGYPVIRIESEHEIEVHLENLTTAKAKGDDCAVGDPQWICPVGVQALGKARAVIHNVQVSGNLAGLMVWGSAEVSLTNSKVSGNLLFGLGVLDSAKVSLTNSKVSGSLLFGLGVGDSAEVSLTNSKVSGNGYGLRVVRSAEVTLTNSTVSGNVAGLGVGDSATVSLTNSKVLGNLFDGLVVWDSAKVSLTNSQVSGNRDDGLSVLDSAIVEIKESIINDNKSCGIFVFSHEAQVHGTPNMMLGNGADLCGFAPAYLRKPSVPQDPRPTLAVPADYATVQQAIDAIVPGGTIEIAAGIYEVGLTIWKPVVLKGAGLNKTILQAMPRRGLVLSIISEVQGVRIEGLHVSGSWEEGLLIYGRDVTIQDALISKNWHGLFVSGSAEVSLTDSQVSGNWDGLDVSGSAKVTITNSQVSGNWDNGLDVSGSAKVTLTNSQVSGNEAGLMVWGLATVSLTNSKVSGNGDNGLDVRDSATVTLTDSIVSDNFFWGLVVLDSAEVSLTNSKVSGNGDNGLMVGGSARVGGSAEVALTNSQVSGNRAGLFVLDSAEVSLTNSKVSGNRWDGLVVGDSAGVSLTNSKVSGNWYSGLVVGDSATAEVRSSTIEGNGTSPLCQELDLICNGIEVWGKSQTTITDSKIINNTDWGVAAALKKCGYYFGYFIGQVFFQGNNVIEGNSTSNNQKDKGNPGDHPWNRPDVPDGQVCLP